MSALESLIRLNRWQLDERRRQLADLDSLADKLRQEQARLAAEQADEQRTAARSPEAGAAYGAYARRLIERRHKLEQSLAAVEQQTVLARDALAEAYREVKRYEIAAANRAAKQRQALAKQQQRTLDDMGIETFRRASK
jgi:flagellar export protein FliJ